MPAMRVVADREGQRVRARRRARRCIAARAAWSRSNISSASESRLSMTADDSYHPLKITQVRPEGSDAVCVTLAVPDELRETFRFAPGQHIGVRATIDGQEVRRTYSIVSGTDERHCASACACRKRGSMSGHVGRKLHVPATRSKCCRQRAASSWRPMPRPARTYCRVRGRQRHHPDSRHRQRTRCGTSPPAASCFSTAIARLQRIMFAEELLALKDRYPQRLVAVLPDEPRAAGRRVVQRPARRCEGRRARPRAVRCARRWMVTSCAGRTR